MQAVPGFNLLNLTFTPPLFPGLVLLGTFGAASPSSLVQVLPADDIAGGTVFDAQGNPLPDFSICVIPEPASGALFALARGGPRPPRAPNWLAAASPNGI